LVDRRDVSTSSELPRPTEAHTPSKEMELRAVEQR